MRTYVQCSYCMGYNTHRIPIMRTFDGRIEMFGKILPSAEFGDNVGILLDVNKEAIHQGGILTKHIIL